MTDQTIRAGEADIVEQCGLAARPPSKAIDTTGPDAALGSAVHDSLQAWIDGQRLDEPVAQPHANKHGVDPATVLELALVAPAALAQIREDLSRLKAEVQVSGGGIRGRVDALNLRYAATKLFSAAILDWKTGRDPTASSKPNQRLAYASAVEAAYGMPAQGYIYAAEVWLATGDILEARYDKDMIAGFRARLADSLAHPTAKPGSHCRYCRRRFECAERDEYLRSSGRALAVIQPGAQTPQVLATLWDQSRLLRQALDTYDKAVDLVIEDEGRLELPDGRVITHQPITRDNIDARKAWPVLRSAGLDDDAINAILRVSKTDLLKAVSAKAPRGAKATAKAEALTALDVAGAITRTQSRRKKVQ